MRASPLKVNYAINFGGALVPIAIALITVPIYVSHIGTARYGMLSIVWVLLGYFGFLDLGLSRASANSLSRIDRSRKVERMRVLVTALAINTTMGIIGSVGLGIFGYLLMEHFLNMPAEIRPEVAAAFPWIALLLPLAMASGVAIGSLESRDDFVAANILQMAANIGGQIPPVIAAVFWSPSLAVVIPVAVACRGIAVLTTLGYVYWLERAPERASFDRATARSLLSYGGWVSVSGILSPLLNTLDQLVLGTVLNVAKVGSYSVPMNLVVRSQIVPQALCRTLFPTLSRAEPEQAREIAGRAASTLAYGYGFLCAPAIFLAPLFFSLWISPDFAREAGPVGQVLLLGAWVNGLAMVPFSLLQAQGKPRLTALFHAIEVVPFVGALLLLTTYFGLIGAAAGWTLRMIVDAALLYRASGITARTILGFSPAILLMFGSALVAVIWPLEWRAALAAAGAIAVAMGALALALNTTIASSIRRLSPASR